MTVRACALPSGVLLSSYQRDGTFTDCYVTEVPREVSQAEYVGAFYTTPLFRVERLILTLCARRSTDAEALALAAGSRDTFAAWRVEARSANQLLLCDFTGRTRSWLMSAAAANGAAAGTQLYFGSAVVPAADRAGEATGGSGKPRLGFAFGSLLGFHKLYSRTLLLSARARLLRARA